MSGDPPRTPEGVAAERVAELLAKHERLLRAAVARACPRHLGIDAEDVAQEARLRLLRALGAATDFDPPASYVYRVATSAAIDAMRRVVARREESFASPMDPDQEGPRDREPASPVEQAPDRLARQRMLLAKVQAALGRLAANRRRAVVLHLRGFTPAETAVLLGWGEEKTRSLIYRGLRDLRELLRKEGIDYEAP